MSPAEPEFKLVCPQKDRQTLETSLDQGRDRSLRLSVREALTGPGADFMSTSPMGADKPIEDIEATLLAATKSALDELVWWAHATMAAKAAEAL